MQRAADLYPIYLEFRAMFGCAVKVSKSSLRPRLVRLGCDDGAVHLTPAQARRVARALLRFADGSGRELA